MEDKESVEIYVDDLTIDEVRSLIDVIKNNYSHLDYEFNDNLILIISGSMGHAKWFGLGCLVQNNFKIVENEKI